MPPPPGMDMGPEPPPPPRKLPEGYALRLLLTENIVTILGIGVTFVGVVATLSMIRAISWAILVGGLFLFVGLSMLRSGLRSGSRTLDAFKNGRPIRGRIASVRQDTSTRVNGRHPWEITYTFEYGGHPHEGKAQTFESATANRLWGGPPVWVLVVENKPERCSLYPPVK